MLHPGEAGWKTPGKACKGRLVRRCLLDQLRLVGGKLLGTQRGFSVPLPQWISGGLIKVTTYKPCSVYVLDQPNYSNVISRRWLQSALLQLRKECSYGRALSECDFWQPKHLCIFPVVSKFIRDPGRWMSVMNTQRLQICSSADWSSTICLHQGKRLGELQKWSRRLINSLMVQEKPQIHLMLFAALVGQAGCESLDKHGFERRYCREHMAF